MLGGRRRETRIAPRFPPPKRSDRLSSHARTINWLRPRRTLTVAGSQGRKRGRRTRSDEGRHRADIGTGLEIPAFEHNQWTVEGYIERLGAFSRGASRATGWKRTVAFIVAVAMLVPIVAGLIVYSVRFLG